MNIYKIWLQRILCLIGAGLLVATIPVFFPVSLMATMHGWLGLGDLPDAPITIYLARSTSLLYAVHGSIMLTTGLRIKELGALVPLLGWIHVVIGLVMLGVDLNAGMPWYWTAVEGVPISLAGLLLLWLWKESQKQTGDGAHSMGLDTKA